ncbi:hypothetical protein FHS59_000056 [Algoriphagus iocasae]|uniref:Uncharacterized protein n=1 Tax=Algoriphagus iocasae TaxID=1836499 RepID=A0A841MQY6_9BACT|nr:hypothetical protein [Algoriphagus iocasae]MBB6324441.1 hypothetical protein [Algoriphagus iocasae]
MKPFVLLFISIFFFSCTKKQEVIQGSLEDFVTGGMSFERGVEVGFMGFQGALEYDGKEVAYTKWNGIFKFFDPKTGRKIDEFQIPKEGPGSLKGGPHIAKVFDNSTIVATNTTGNAIVYKNKSVSAQFQLDMSDLESNDFFSFPMGGNALHQVSNDEYELTLNPFDVMAHRVGKDGFDLDFSSWILKFDDQGNWICKTDFKSPYDESYANSSQASAMVRMVENGNSWAMFSYSDSLYQIKDCQVVDTRKLESITPMTYFPDKYEGDKNRGAWKLQENGSMNIRLFQDISSGLNVRMTLIKHRQPDPDILDPRQKMFLDENTYLLLIYDPDWKLRGELEIIYPSGTRFENIFSTSEGLFINKPEQKSEDEYEFYKLDLTQFTD